MSSNYPTNVDAFLRQLGQARTGNLSRVWQAFMAYAMCIVIQAFQRRGYKISPMNSTSGFRFKCFPRGEPDDYSYFRAQKETESLEIRLNVDARNRRWNSMTLNLDILVISENSIGVDNIVDSGRDLVSFAECKNLRGFPELVAAFEGMTYELQRTRLYSNNPSNFRIPACLLLSQAGRSIQFMNRRYQNRNMSLKIFDFLQPGNPNIQHFIQTWF